MTTQERIRALAEMGYLPREAEFLCLAALHSGYFLRRQYCRFLGVRSGGSEKRLIGKLLKQRHASERRFGSRTKLIQLCSRRFYRAIGQPENPHRRPRPLPAVQVKVMSLDFVLAHRDCRFLATEEEKVEHFHGGLGIDLRDLPQKVYHSPKGGPSTTRYFVDKLPVLLCGDSVAFAYVDAGAITCSGFATFLRRHLDLWTALPGIQTFYVSDLAYRMRWAKWHYDEFVAKIHLPAYKLLRFFELEKLYRERAFDQLTQASLIELREARRRFQGSRVEKLFGLWLAEGERAIRWRIGPSQPDKFQFVGYPLKESYDFFQYA